METTRGGKVSRANYGGHWIRERRRVAIYERDEWKCVYCGKPARTLAWYRSTNRPDLDHVIPRALGGSHDATNVVTCCGYCNVSKGDADLFTWLGQRVERERLTLTQACEIVERVQRACCSPLAAKANKQGGE